MSKELIEKISLAIPVATEQNNRWAIGFLTDIKAQLVKGRRGLSEKQRHYLDKTLKNLDPASVKHDPKWVAEWSSNEELREKAKVISDYYGTTTYYRNSVTEVRKALSGELETPRQKMVLSMIENKYAEKVWDSHIAEAKWAVGDVVKVRAGIDFGRLHFEGSTNPFARRRYIGYNDDTPVITDHSCIVLEVNSRPIDKSLSYKPKAGGTRYYKLLPIGFANPFHAMEMDLKKTRKSEIS